MSAHDLVTQETWFEKASCRGAPNPDLWFPDRGADVKAPKAICALCPVKLECLEYALEHRIECGIWGGESERSRRRMRRGRLARRRCQWCGDIFSTVKDLYCSDGCRAMAKRQSSTQSYHRRVS